MNNTPNKKMSLSVESRTSLHINLSLVDAVRLLRISERNPDPKWGPKWEIITYCCQTVQRTKSSFLKPEVLCSHCKKEQKFAQFLFALLFNPWEQVVTAK